MVCVCLVKRRPYKYIHILAHILVKRKSRNFHGFYVETLVTQQKIVTAEKQKHVQEYKYRKFFIYFSDYIAQVVSGQFLQRKIDPQLGLGFGLGLGAIFLGVNFLGTRRNMFILAEIFRKY